MSESFDQAGKGEISGEGGVGSRRFWQEKKRAKKIAKKMAEFFGHIL